VLSKYRAAAAVVCAEARPVVKRKPGPQSEQDQLRRALLEATQTRIAACGLSGVSARTLAADVGCSAAGIYRIFGDLDSLILEANLGTLILFDGYIARTRTEGFARNPSGARDFLVRLALAYLDFALDHTNRWRALFEFRWTVKDRPLPEWYSLEQVRLFSYIESPLREICPDLDEPGRRALARSLFSVTHGLVSLGLDQRLMPFSPEVLRGQIRTVVGATARGLGSDGIG
jgi:AcrR family transcriptional regulator